MPEAKLTRELVKKCLEKNMSVTAIIEKYGGSRSTLVKYKREIQHDKDTWGDKVTTDKKIGTMDWRNMLHPLKDLQTQFKEAKSSQDVATWKVKTDQPICVAIIGDLHMGSWATDYDMLVQVTNEIINTPNLYVILVGDLLQMSIKLRGVLEVADNALPPMFQLMFLDSWLQEIKHKVIASTWDNHSVMREENGTGFSKYAEIFSRHVIYHNGIGHLTVNVNNQSYNFAVGHFFRGRSIFNPLHGHMRYIRHEGHDRDIVASGDSHEAGVMQANISGKRRVALNCGSIQNSGYGKRFFSLVNQPVFPCINLSHSHHSVTPYWSVKDWLEAAHK